MKATFSKSLFLLALFIAFMLQASSGYAHPLGNFSVNHYSRITLTDHGIEIRYILDLAEIPTYQEMQQGNFIAKADDPRVLAFVAARAEDLGHGLRLSLDGKSIPLHLVSQDVIFPPGAGGLPTMKMGFVYRAAYPQDIRDTTTGLTFEDQNYQGHQGWKEIIVSDPRWMLLQSSVPARDRSDELSNYPTDLLNSPPQDLTASIQFRLHALPEPHAGQPAPANFASRVSHATAKLHEKISSTSNANPATHAVGVSDVPRLPSQTSTAVSTGLKANQKATPRNALTELILSSRIGVWFLITAGLVAFGLGALHALEPGHGKTIVAAYLVGSRGTARHAALLGIIVTVSHTAGVFALGAITLYASRYIVPERLYSWLGVLSGLLIAGLGGYMLLRRWTGEDGDHSHAAGQLHSHWFTSKKPLDIPTIPQPVLDRSTAKAISLSQLIVLGITGGIIPCPAALVVLLSALTLHRIGFGLLLIVAFSLGLAAILVAFGMLTVYARQFMARFKVDGSFTTRWLPLASAAFMTLLGAIITVQTLLSTGLHIPPITKANLDPFLFVVGLGLILGVRHSTDPDHVVALSTIVSRQRTIRQAALIGTFWGLGHTLTIFVIGCLIILCGIVIPPRVGLSMEFSVALMLIVLGLLNLSGLMRKITERISNIRKPQSGGRAFTGMKLLVKDRSVSGHTLAMLSAYQFTRPLLIGIVHGLAGSAAVALLVLSTIHSPVWAVAYLLVFGAGTMLGMMCMTTVMAVPLAYAGNRFTRVSRYLGLASGVVSLCFGTFLVYQLGFLGGLFTSHPHWTPQ